MNYTRIIHGYGHSGHVVFKFGAGQALKPIRPIQSI